MLKLTSRQRVDFVRSSSGRRKESLKWNWKMAGTHAIDVEYETSGGARCTNGS